jgi:carbamoyl-phosphate synthase large subunit
MAKSRTTIDNLSILFTCIGRRVSLLNSFRRAGRQLKIDLSLLGTDATELSSALQLCDKGFPVRPITHANYIKQLLSIVRTNNVKLLIPTIDTDLLVLAQNKPKFAELGCSVLVSEPSVVEICQDKRKTHKFLVTNGFDAPETISPRTALTRKKISWPCLLKPWDGAAGKNVIVVNNRKELAFFAHRIPNAICQELVKGTEYTCDVYVDFGMKVRCVVPRKRIETRAGEVSKGQVVKNDEIMTLAAELVRILKAGPGVITVQCFLQQNGNIKFSEINPRFGGGAPLAIKAGANFPKWILQELVGGKPRIKFDGFKDGLTMLRYDAEVWVERKPFCIKLQNEKRST